MVRRKAQRLRLKHKRCSFSFLVVDCLRLSSSVVLVHHTATTTTAPAPPQLPPQRGSPWQGSPDNSTTTASPPHHLATSLALHPCTILQRRTSYHLLMYCGALLYTTSQHNTLCLCVQNTFLQCHHTDLLGKRNLQLLLDNRYHSFNKIINFVHCMIVYITNFIFICIFATYHLYSTFIYNTTHYNHAYIYKHTTTI